MTASDYRPAARSPVPVTVDNFVRAESDMYFGVVVKQGGFGRFAHHRELMSIDKQDVVRANRDTLYSGAVFDLDAGPVTITLPDAGRRFMSMMVIDEDQHACTVVYGSGTHTFAREEIGTRYVLMGVRTLVNPSDPNDVKEVHALQDAIVVRQLDTGRFEVPNWDPVGQKKIRDALAVLGSTLPDLKNTFGTKGQVSDVRHLIGTAIGWGGNPEKDAIYLNDTPTQNDGATVYRLHVKDVPVDGFWSVSVYNADGYFERNRFDAYTVNSITAAKNADGSVTIQFGGCDGSTLNCLPTMPGWNYMVRLYRPRPALLSGTWVFPEAEPVQQPAGMSR
jgi:hypothetical protein